MLNTAAYERSRNPSRRTNGRDGRKYRGNGTRNTNSSARSNNNNGGYTSRNTNGNLSEYSNSSRSESARERRHGNRAGRGGRWRNRNDGKNRHGRCNYCRNSTEHGWHGCPLRHSHQESEGTYHVSAAQVSSQRECIFHAWCSITENADLENFQVVIGDGAERPPSNDEVYEHVTNTKVQEDVAFPAMMDIGTDTTPVDTAVFIDTAASNHMVPAGSQLCQHVVNKIDCCMHVRRSCGVTTARTKGTLAFRVRNDRGELVPVHLEVSIVPNLEASVFSVGALNEKGVKLDLMANPPVLRDGNSAFPVSMECPRTFVLRILLDGQDKSPDKILSHAAMDTDSCHRRMDPCRPRAMKQLAEELTTGANYDIDSSGAGKPTVIGYTLAKLRTDETVDHGN